MTWGFVYLSVLIVGLVLAAATGLLRDLPAIASHRHLIVPRPEQHVSTLNLLGRRLGLTMVAFGAVGLLLKSWSELGRDAVLAVAGAVALVAGALSFVLIRSACPPTAGPDRATVVREMGPGGYGQVRIGDGESAPIVAARSADDESLPPGTLVEIVDCSRSVVIVRRPGETSQQS